MFAIFGSSHTERPMTARKLCARAIVAAWIAAFSLVSSGVFQNISASALTVGEFQADNSGLLKLTGDELVSAVRDLVLADVAVNGLALANPQTLNAIAVLITTASQAQQS